MSWQVFEFLSKAVEEILQIRQVGDGTLLRFLKQFNLAENVSRRVVKRRGSNQDDAFAAAYLRQLFVGYVHLGTEAVCFVNKDVLVFVRTSLDKMFKLSQGFKFSRHPEIGEHVGP